LGIVRTPTRAVPRWDDVLPPQSWVRIAVLTGLLTLAYGHVLMGMVGKWLHDANWSHGWLVPLFSVFFLVTRRAQLLYCRPRTNWIGGVILVAALTLYFVSAWRLRMGYPQAVSLVVAIFGLTLLMGGWSVVRIAWFPIVFLLLAVPLPQSVYVDLTMPLRKFASQVSAVVMPWFAPGLHAEPQAVVIDYVMPGRGSGQLNVEEACSGMRSIMAFVTLGVAMAYLHERPTWQRIALLASCVPIAVLCNTIRVTITGLMYVYDRQELARGTPHELLGVAMFLVALGMYSALGYALSNFFVEEREG